MAIYLLFCLFAPFPLWLVETLLPFPYIVEELFKFFVISKNKNQRLFFPLLCGLIFALSETMLYLVNFWQLGDFSNLPLRIFLTTSLHISTFVLQFLFRHSRVYFILSLILSILIHYLYNLIIAS